MHQVLERARRIRLLAFDVDGVLTDGRLHLSDAGVESKVFHARDGHGIKLLRESGVEVALISGREAASVTRRAAELGIGLLYQGVADKRAVLETLLAELDLAPEAAGYMGDDVVDLPAMLCCGLALTVPEAPAAVRRHAHFVTQAPGGGGAVREACELVMAAQGTLDALLARWLAPDSA